MSRSISVTSFNTGRYKIYFLPNSLAFLREGMEACCNLIYNDIITCKIRLSIILWYISAVIVWTLFLVIKLLFRILQDLEKIRFFLKCKSFLRIEKKIVFLQCRFFPTLTLFGVQKILREIKAVIIEKKTRGYLLFILNLNFFAFLKKSRFKDLFRLLCGITYDKTSFQPHRKRTV